MKMVEDLRQRATESVAAFRDRCEAVQHILERDIPAAQRTGDARATFEARHANEVLNKFLCGLREAGGLKQTVATSATATTLEEYYVVALRAERAQPRPAGAAIAAVHQEDGGAQEGEGNDQEVAAFGPGGRGRGGGGGYQGRGGANGGGGAGRGRGGGAAGSRPNVVCWWCAKPGHVERVCRSKLAGRPSATGTPGGAANGGGVGGGAGVGGAAGGQPQQPAWINALQEQLLQLGMQQLQARLPGGNIGGNPPGFL
jgi:hypothetical protein